MRGLTIVSSYAVIQTGGKQYRVQPGDVIDVEKLEQEVGARIDLADVLLVGGDDAVSVGTPTVDGAKVTAEVADQFRGPKIIVYKYKAKTHYRRKNGHRQSYTRLRIRHILTDGAEEPEEVVEAVVEEAVEEAPAPRRRRRSTRATAAAAAEEPAAEEAAADEAAAEEPVAAAEEAEAAEVVEAEASVEAEEAPAEEASEEAPAEETAEEAASEEAGEEEKKAE
ncbi:MAG: 50S ribosomal protein L21 [Chloroflexi bacterium]|nr:50S ribosomal protein L21 [Chloroflexota bacterium]